MGLPRHSALRRTADFQSARISGFSQECGVFLWNLYRRPENPEFGRRFGVVASRRIGNAVYRNRAKRRLRALFQKHQNLLPECCDLVLVARRRVLTAAWSELESVFLRMAQKS